MTRGATNQLVPPSAAATPTMAVPQARAPLQPGGPLPSPPVQVKALDADPVPVADGPRPLSAVSFTERHRVLAGLLTLVALVALGAAIGEVLGQMLAHLVAIVVTHTVGPA